MSFAQVLAESKRAMRAEMRGVLRALPSDTISSASAKACERALAALEDCKHVSVYLAMPKECQTTVLLEKLFARGTNVYVPKVEGVPLLAAPV